MTDPDPDALLWWLLAGTALIMAVLVALFVVSDEGASGPDPPVEPVAGIVT
jgi:hypothetical protein